MNEKDPNMTIPQHDLTKQWNCYMFFPRGHEIHFSAMKYSLFLLPKLECFIITDTCIFLFFASRASLVLRWVQQSSGTCFNRWVTCIWMQLRLHNNLMFWSVWTSWWRPWDLGWWHQGIQFFFLFLDCEFTLSTYSYRVIRQICYEKRKRKLPCDGLFSRFPFHFIFNYFSFSIPLYLLFLVLAFLDKGKEIFTNLFSATAERLFQTLLSLRFIYLVFIRRSTLPLGFKVPMNAETPQKLKIKSRYLPKACFDPITLVGNSAFCNYGKLFECKEARPFWFTELIFNQYEKATSSFI